MPNINLSILNQKATPSFYADILANRPAPSFVGRVFISTDTYDLYRDTGSAWVLLSPSSTGTITGGGSLYRVGIWTSTSNLGESNDLIFDYSQGHLGINTNTPGTALDVHHDQPTIAILNQTNATNDTRLGFQNNGVGLWRIGNFYNSGANDFAVYDVVNSLERFSVKNTGQTFIGPQTTSSGKLVVNQTASDQGIVVLGTTAPSIRVRTAGVGATQQFGLGLSTGVNNFIQGSASGDFCIFNGSSTASPITFGIYDAVALNNQEAARISASRNFLIGTTTDSGYKLNVNGTALINGNVLAITGTGLTEFKINNGTTEWEIYMPNGSTDFRFYRGTDKVTFTSAGNVGIGVIPNAWSAFPAIQFTNQFSVASVGTSKNAYFDGSDYRYITSSYASLFQQVSNGSFAFFNASSGTAGNTISFNQVMTLANTGNLLIGTTTDAGQKLQVNGDIRGNIINSENGTTASLGIAGSTDITTINNLSWKLVQANGNSNTTNYATAIAYANSVGGVTIIPIGSSGLVFSSSGANQITITNGGTAQTISWTTIILK